MQIIFRIAPVLLNVALALLLSGHGNNAQEEPMLPELGEMLMNFPCNNTLFFHKVAPQCRSAVIDFIFEIEQQESNCTTNFTMAHFEEIFRVGGNYPCMSNWKQSYLNSSCVRDVHHYILSSLENMGPNCVAAEDDMFEFQRKTFNLYYNSLEFPPPIAEFFAKGSNCIEAMAELYDLASNQSESVQAFYTETFLNITNPLISAWHASTLPVCIANVKALLMSALGLSSSVTVECSTNPLHQQDPSQNTHVFPFGNGVYQEVYDLSRNETLCANFFQNVALVDSDYLDLNVTDFVQVITAWLANSSYPISTALEAFVTTNMNETCLATFLTKASTFSFSVKEFSVQLFASKMLEAIPGMDEIYEAGCGNPIAAFFRLNSDTTVAAFLTHLVTRDDPLVNQFIRTLPSHCVPLVQNLFSASTSIEDLLPPLTTPASQFPYQLFFDGGYVLETSSLFAWPDSYGPFVFMQEYSLLMSSHPGLNMTQATSIIELQANNIGTLDYPYNVMKAMLGPIWTAQPYSIECYNCCYGCAGNKSLFLFELQKFELSGGATTLTPALSLSQWAIASFKDIFPSFLQSLYVRGSPIGSGFQVLSAYGAAHNLTVEEVILAHRHNIELLQDYYPQYTDVANRCMTGAVFLNVTMELYDMKLSGDMTVGNLQSEVVDFIPLQVFQAMLLFHSSSEDDPKYPSTIYDGTSSWAYSCMALLHNVSVHHANKTVSQFIASSDFTYLSTNAGLCTQVPELFSAFTAASDSYYNGSQLVPMVEKAFKDVAVWNFGNFRHAKKLVYPCRKPISDFLAQYSSEMTLGELVSTIRRDVGQGYSSATSSKPVWSLKPGCANQLFSALRDVTGCVQTFAPIPLPTFPA